MTVGTAVKVKVPLCDWTAVKVPLCDCLDSGQGPPVWVFGQRSRSPCVAVWTAVKVPLCDCWDKGQGQGPPV